MWSPHVDPANRLEKCKDRHWGALNSSLDAEASPVTCTASITLHSNVSHFFSPQLVINLTEVKPYPSALRPLPLAFSFQSRLSSGLVSLPSSQWQGQEDNPALSSQIVDFFSHPTLPAGAAFLCWEGIIWGPRDSIYRSTKYFLVRETPWFSFLPLLCTQITALQQAGVDPLNKESDYGWENAET